MRTGYTLPTVEGCCRIWLYSVVVVKPDIKGLCEIKNETRSDLSPLEGVHLLHTAPPVYWCPMSASFFFVQFTCASIASIASICVSSISTHSLPYSVSLPPSATCHFIPRPQCPVGSKCDISWWDQRPHGRRILLRPLLRHLIYHCPRRYKGLPLTSPLPRFNGACAVSKVSSWPTRGTLCGLMGSTLGRAHTTYGVQTISIRLMMDSRFPTDVMGRNWER